MKERKLGPVWLWYALALFLVLADQEVKLWVRTHMTLGESRPFIPHVLELLYVENTGGAFSLLDRFTGVLTVVSAVATVVLALALWRGWFITTPFARLGVTLVLAGAAGNLIDRVTAHQVTDMFNFTFMRFGVFNVADVCVTVGIVCYAIYALTAPDDPRGEDRP